LDQNENKTKRIFGLIGKSIDHSFSPQYFKLKFTSEKILNVEYKLFPLDDIKEIKNLLNGNVIGLNVTIPFKQSVIPFLDELDQLASEINAVNTIKVTGKKSKGYNTDIFGFEKSLSRFLKTTKGIAALVLGSGGASKAVLYVLKKMKIKANLVSRSKGDLSYEELSGDIISKHKLIINCTPLGMQPELDSYPKIPYEHLTEKHYLFDLIYNPEKTLFLEKGELRGSRIQNGYEMLCLQADQSWEIWNNE